MYRTENVVFQVLIDFRVNVIVDLQFDTNPEKSRVNI